MIPKIRFRYSWIYDQHFREHSKKRYPSIKKILSYIKQIEKIWEKDGNKILKELEKASNMRFKERKIICYIVGRAIPFSDPLTLKIYKNKDRFIDTLIHELIHQLFIQNMGKTERLMKPIHKKYRKENWNVRIHILLDRIHKKFYEKIGWQERMEDEIKYMSHLKDYKRAWELALKEDRKI